MENNSDLFKNITTFIFDVDGVLTDGTILLLMHGEQARAMSTKDGYSMQLAIRKGYKMMIISGGVSMAVEGRLRKLGIEEIHMGTFHKRGLLEDFIVKHGLRKEELLYMGDDIPDLPCFSVVGLPTCPNDAVPDVKEAAAYVSTFNGGYGCVRDVVEKVLKARGDWEVAEDIPSR